MKAIEHVQQSVHSVTQEVERKHECLKQCSHHPFGFKPSQRNSANTTSALYYIHRSIIIKKICLTFVDEQLVQRLSPLHRLFWSGPANKGSTVFQQTHLCQVSHCMTHSKLCPSLARVCVCEGVSLSVWVSLCWTASFICPSVKRRSWTNRTAC